MRLTLAQNSTDQQPTEKVRAEIIEEVELVLAETRKRWQKIAQTYAKAKARSLQP